jgi:anti-sigma B factor antagonist
MVSIISASCFTAIQEVIVRRTHEPADLVADRSRPDPAPMRSDLPLTAPVQTDATRRTTSPWPVRVLAAHDHDQDAAVVSFDGEIDLGTGPVVREALLQALERETGPVVVDLTEVPFMDSTGVHILVDTLGRLERQNRALAIACREGGQVHRLLALVGLLDALTVHGSRDSAVIGGEDRLPSAPGTDRQPPATRALTQSLLSARQPNPCRDLGPANH